MKSLISSGFVVIIVNDLQRFIESIISSITNTFANRPRSENKPVLGSKTIAPFTTLINVEAY